MVGGTVYGDMPFHLNFITSLLWGANKHASPVTAPMNATFYQDHALVYPFVPDYHAAQLVGSGSSFHFSFFVPGFLLTASFLYLLFFFNLRLTGSIVSASLAVPLTIFSGGIGGFLWAMHDGTWAGAMRVDHVLYHVNDPNANSAWFSLVAHILFPQRTTQFAYPISLLAMILAYRALESHAGLTSGDVLRTPARSNRLDGRSSPNPRGSSPPEESSLPAKSTNKKNDDDILFTPRRKTPSKSSSTDIRRTSMPLDVTYLLPTEAERTRLLIGAGLTTGLLPLLQAHSFVAVGLIMIVVAAFELLDLIRKVIKQRYSVAAPAQHGASLEPKRPSLKFNMYPWLNIKSCIKTWAIYGLAAFAVGLPQSMIYFAKAAGGQKVTHPDGRITPFIRFVPLWHDQHESGPMALWWEALLYFVPLNMIGLVILPLSNVQWRFQVGMFTVFLMANVVIFQPWELDNTKVFYVWMFGAAGCVGQMIRRLYRAAEYLSSTHRLGAVSFLMRAVAIISFAGLIFTGGLCMLKETYSFDPMFDMVDVEQAKWINENTPMDARFVTSTHGTHFRPASALGGRSLLTSYVGWVSNHGMPGWIQRNEDQNHLQEGRNKHLAWNNILKHNMTHMVFQAAETSRWDINFLNSYAYRVASNGRSTVYKFAPRETFENPQDCAPKEAIDESKCIARNCVWVPHFKGPWCQVKPTIAGYRSMGWDKDPVPHDCGNVNTNQQGCHRRGCSWVAGYKGPWCHEALSLPSGADHGRGGMTLLTSAPVDCGWHNIDEVSCIDRGCKWLPKANVPWCTKP